MPKKKNKFGFASYKGWAYNPNQPTPPGGELRVIRTGNQPTNRGQRRRQLPEPTVQTRHDSDPRHVAPWEATA